MNFDISMLLNKLFGDIQPLCDQHFDDERYENIIYYEETLEYVVNELIECAKWKKDNRYSANRIGAKTYNILKIIIEKIEDELRIIDEEE